MAAAEIGSAAQESQTFDEATHLAAGYAQLVLGETQLNVEHPPLAKLLAAAAVLPLGPRMARGGPGWKPLDEILIGKEFLYKNRVPADRLLAYGRSVTMAFSIALAIAVAVWTRRYFGAGAGLLAGFLCAFDPNLIAHGHYISNDIHLTLFLFLASMSWVAWLKEDRTRDLISAAAWTALALAAKFSAVILAPVLGLLYAIAWRREPVSFPPRRLARAAVLVTGILVVVFVSVYLPSSARQHGSVLRFGVVPLQMWADGFGRLMEHNSSGQESYLMGERSTHGWWYFFPVVFAVKTPAAVLAPVLICTAMAIHRLVVPLPLKLRDVGLEWWGVIVPILAYGGAVLASNLNLGARHLLPVYPLLYAFLAGILFRVRPRLYGAIVCSIVLLEAAESVRIYPDYLAFFNTPSGGPAQGASWLVDSSLDWGQDLKKLRAWWDARGRPKICLHYFGAPDPSEFGFAWEFLPYTKHAAERAEADCIGVVSATLLKDVYMEPGAYQWLRDRQPMGTVGYSIYLYDLRKSKEP